MNLQILDVDDVGRGRSDVAGHFFNTKYINAPSPLIQTMSRDMWQCLLLSRVLP